MNTFLVDHRGNFETNHLYSFVVTEEDIASTHVDNSWGEKTSTTVTGSTSVYHTPPEKYPHVDTSLKGSLEKRLAGDNNTNRELIDGGSIPDIQSGFFTKFAEVLTPELCDDPVSLSPSKLSSKLVRDVKLVGLFSSATLIPRRLLLAHFFTLFSRLPIQLLC